MTMSDTQTGNGYVWPAGPLPGPEWKQIPGYSAYEWSHRGRVRSLDRVVAGRSYRGTGLKTRLNNSGYVQVNVTNDKGIKQTVLLHRMILLAHAGECPDGQETLHGPGGQADNRYPENIRYGTHPENVAERVAAAPPRAVKPPRLCVNYDRCGGHVTRGGKRCHDCVVTLGRSAAALLEEDGDLERVAEMLGYPSAAGIYKLACKYGGLRVYVVPDAITPGDTADGNAPQPQSWLHTVTARWMRWLAGGDSE